LRLNPTLSIVSFYCIIIFLMALSFFVSILGFLWFAYIMVCMWLILKQIQLKNTLA
jgi:hypothetical protein